MLELLEHLPLQYGALACVASLQHLARLLASQSVPSFEASRFVGLVLGERPLPECVQEVKQA